jgi:glucoside 3-dehydrogenase (cytochrome c) hitch-hiker subunit
MKRREALKRTTLILGYAISASAISGVLNGCTNESMSTASTPDGADDWAPELFSREEIDLIAELCETILPETDTPGAKAANVHRYIDIMLKDHYQIRDQRVFSRGLVRVDEDCLSIYGEKFARSTPDNQLEYLSKLEEESKTKIEQGGEHLGSRPFFAILKELTWIGFFTSELIGEQYLSYDPIPGVYHGCIPLKETGNRNWSL